MSPLPSIRLSPLPSIRLSPLPRIRLSPLPRIGWRGWFCAWWIIFAGLLPAWPQSPSPTEDALSRTPWFDPASDSLLPVDVETSLDDSQNRDSRWLPPAQRVRRASSSGGNALASGSLWGTGLTIGNLFGWALLVLIVIAVAGALVYAFAKTSLDLAPSRAKGERVLEGLPDEQTIQRMQHLPSELRRTDVNLRSEAFRLIELGRFDQALILLFGHQLLLLDVAGALRLNRGKTNGQYLLEARRFDLDIGKHLATTVQAFERSYFGKHVLSVVEMETLWRENESLEQAVRRRQEVAA